MLTLDEMVGLLKASGEPTRMRLLSLLAEGDLSVKDLTAILHQSQPRISRHLKLLYEAGLVERLPEGAWVYYCLTRDEAKGDLIAAALRHVDQQDVMIRRDRERLEQIRTASAQQAADYFQQNAERWDELRALHVPESAVEQAIVASLGDKPIDQLLDLGTGTGSILSLLAHQCRYGLGLDANRSMLAIARSRLDGPNHGHLHVQQGNILDLASLDRQFDLVTLHQVLHYLDDPSAALEEASNVIAPGGRILVVDFAPHSHEFLRKDHAHRRLGFSHDAMRRWMAEAGFKLTIAKDLEQERRLVEMSDTPLTVTVWVATKMAGSEPI
ncbi:ArsR/SmtB family transcription factor [Cohaesibacter celericrescens]|uniref:ArsR family transcriptional regulator n=1 Tax=Cohaesibacter celericrescens TaxID=2067669 RepID=A0A2N5XWT6_9HYPH|nr:metalloregulator ArsR/SmtB family transcription factor [Cohaesibacter celericrescens]PLW75564.1 ArsR family transcriptional regulator [Cohaesibacter celericrescens]PLW78971.1 ArsR family transcriptional regulator [Cohaesibacter celericrescens]